MPEPDAVHTLPDFQSELQLICDAAEEAGRIALGYYNDQSQLDVQLKNGGSPVSAADYAVDVFLRQRLQAARPNYGWLSEETIDADITHRINAPRTFVVDPIDGTRAFIQGYAVWCVSIAIVQNGQTIAGVLACPALGLEYSAGQGLGAFLNGEPLDQLGEQEPVAVFAGNATFGARLAHQLNMDIAHHHHVPSLAIRIAMVADRSIGGTLVRPNSNDWDIAAAELILREVGGAILDGQGAAIALNGLDTKKPTLIAAGPHFIPAMLSVVAE